MSKPTNKEELVSASNINYDKLMGLINKFPPKDQQRTFPEGTLNRNIRDVLAHLYHWHKLFLTWYEKGMEGVEPEMPVDGYTWKDTQALNKVIREKYKNIPLGEVKIMFEMTHAQLNVIISKHTDEELFTKKLYKWTGSTSLGAYVISATSSHYDWAYKLIKKSLK